MKCAPGHVAIVVTEACTNILKHAQRGEILLQVTDHGVTTAAVRELEMLALDKGPGMQNSSSACGMAIPPAARRAKGWALLCGSRMNRTFIRCPEKEPPILARWRSDAAAGRSGSAKACGSAE